MPNISVAALQAVLWINRNGPRTCVNIHNYFKTLFIPLSIGTKSVRSASFTADLSALPLPTGAWDIEEAANVGSAETGRERRHGEQEQGPGRGAGADRAPLRQGLDHEARPARGRGDRINLDRLAGSRHRARHRRPAQGPRLRNPRPGKLGQNHGPPARHRRSPEEGRQL